MQVRNFLVSMSAIMLNLALIFPEYLWWLIFFYLVPLFQLNKKKLLSKKEGLLWGIVFYSIHFYFFFVVINQKAAGEYKIFVPLIVIIYFSIYSMLWFYLSYKLYELKINKDLLFSLLTFLHICFIYNYSFWIFQRACGYVFTFPMIPLVDKVNLSFGIWPTTLFLIFCNALFYLSLTDKRFIKFYILLLFFLFFSFEKKQKISFTHNCLCAPENKQNPYQLGQDIKFEILKLVKKSPETKIILMPESSFPFPLNNYQEIIEWWYCDLINKDIHIILGSHRREKLLFNTVYHLYKGKIINYYDKTHLMFFTEQIPIFWRNFSVLSNLFLKNSEEFSAGSKSVCFDLDGIKAAICICSDLFLQKKIECQESDIILFFMNDSWFSVGYVKKIIELYIKLKNREINKEIVCINQNL